MKEIDRILSELKSNDEKIALSALRRLEDTNVASQELAVPEIGRILSISHNETVIAFCIHALASIGGKNAIQELQIFMLVCSDLKSLYLIGETFISLGSYRDATLIVNYLERLGMSGDLPRQFTPLSLEEMTGDCESPPDRNESPMPGLKFKDECWTTLISQKSIGSPVYFELVFAHSNASNGPDKLQIKSMDAISQIDKPFWRMVNRAVIQWLIDENPVAEESPTYNKENWPKVARFVVPKAFEKMTGAYAIQFDSDWEFEHGIECFVLPGKEIIVLRNDNLSHAKNWWQALGVS